MTPILSILLARRAALALLVAGLGLSAAACRSGASMQRLDPSKDDTLGGTLIDSADVEEITKRAADDLARVLLASPRNDITVAFPPIKNESLQPINTANFSDPIRDRIFQAAAPRVKFVAREQLDEVMKEREGKRSGVFSGEERKQLLGANYLLTGRIISLSKRYEGDRADFFQLSFQLVDAEDGSMTWSNTYKFKKQGESGVIYQ